MQIFRISFFIYFFFFFKYERTRTFVLCENMAPLLQARCSVGKYNIPLILFLSLQQASYDLVPLASFASLLLFSPFLVLANVFLVWKQSNNVLGILIYCLGSRVFGAFSNVLTEDDTGWCWWILSRLYKRNWHEIALC